MPVHAGISRVAAVLADPAREAILAALADGRALPAGELAAAAGISAQSASGHLRRLVEGRILSVWQQGRFRYFRLADEQVAVALEALAVVARPGAGAKGDAARLGPLLEARSCYDHLAGRLGVALTEALRQRGYIEMSDDAVALTRSGQAWAAAAGFLAADGATEPRALRLCLDWTERRFHLAGSLPRAMLGHLFETGRLRRGRERALVVTRAGKAWFGALGVRI
jgi:DNA-binding transcriptional ArsR family regulator